MATRVKRKSWKAIMDLGRDPREGIFSIFRVDCSLVVGLCFYNHYIYVYIYVYTHTHTHKMGTFMLTRREMFRINHCMRLRIPM